MQIGAPLIYDCDFDNEFVVIVHVQEQLGGHKHRNLLFIKCSL